MPTGDPVPTTDTIHFLTMQKHMVYQSKFNKLLGCKLPQIKFNHQLVKSKWESAAAIGSNP